MQTCEQIVNELKNYPKRLRKTEKKKFRSFLHKKLNEWGLSTAEFKSKRLLKSVDVFTKSEKPDVVVMAHYDTPTIIPPWLNGLFQLIGHTRQISLIIFVIVALGALNALGGVGDVIYYVLLASLLTLFIPNPHNANDNTSGVAGVLYLAQHIGRDDELKKRVQLVFVDNEEWGLLGSSDLRRHWLKSGIPFDRTNVISLDCIGRGSVPMVIQNGTSDVAQALYQIMHQDRSETRLKNMKFIPLSDNFSFRQEGAVNVSLFNKSIIPGGFYIIHAHSPRDKSVNADNISWVAERVLDYIKYVQNTASEQTATLTEEHDVHE